MSDLAKPETLNAKLERLASVIADEALAADVPLATRIDSMKCLTLWRVGIGKLKDKGFDDTEPAAGQTMQQMRQAVAETEDEP